jgi:predicted metalloprotease
MRLNRSRVSSNVEDRRRGGSRMAKGGGIGLGAVILALVAAYFGVDPSVVLDMAQGPAPAYQQPAQPIPAEDADAQFVARVLGETEETWQAVFQTQTNGSYQEPTLVLFRGATPTACGTGQSAMGPFYCPGDSKVYIDLSFFEEMQRSLGATGDFAQAYVIAHEVGHHIQNLLGTSTKYQQAVRQLSQTQANQLSVRMELQADCYAGVWAHHAQAARQILEDGDVEEGLRAASAVGDDALQRRAQGHVVPDSFTHGTSAQRSKWFRTGLESGALRDCDTFSASQP